MSPAASLPFTLRRSWDVFNADLYTSTTETVHGLLRLEAERLVIQWRLARKTETYGKGMRTDEELEDIREVAVPLHGVAGGHVRRGFWRWLTGPRLVLTASDLRAFEAVAGEEGLKLKHPAELVFRLRRSDRLRAEEFTAELALTLAHLAVVDGSERPAVGGGSPWLSLGSGEASGPEQQTMKDPDPEG